MKIISKDNFDREEVADVLIAENVNEFAGKRIVNLLNESEGYNSQVFYKLVENDYRLWRGMDELM